MASDRMRQRIASEAARRIALREESEYVRAKLTAARQLSPGIVRPEELPTDREVREQVRAFVNDPASSERRPDAAPADDQVIPLVLDRREVDRYEVFETLLLSLEQVQQNPKHHPEGDALYHSLQVFQQAYETQPYDEEFLLAALLHDVGKAIDRQAPVAAGLAVLEGLISERTAWLIEHRPDAVALRDHQIGARSRRRLEASEDFDDVMLLADCDREGRKQGVAVLEPSEALQTIREVSQANGGY